MTDKTETTNSETEKVTMRTFRAFDTATDALTFAKFLESTGYTNITHSYVELYNLWRVWFDIKW